MAKGDLTPKQEAFVTVYHENRDASEAAAAVGLELACVPPSDGYYVYFLLCPQMRRILYVGKGRGKRMYHHMREHRTGKISGAKKHRTIREYTSIGLSPIAVVFQDGLDDSAALALEKTMLFAIGPRILSNTLACTGNRWQRDLENCNAMLSRVKPFCQWLRDKNPEPKDFGLYAWWVAHARGNQTELIKRAG